MKLTIVALGHTEEIVGVAPLFARGDVLEPDLRGRGLRTPRRFRLRGEIDVLRLFDVPARTSPHDLPGSLEQLGRGARLYDREPELGGDIARLHARQRREPLSLEQAQYGMTRLRARDGPQMVKLRASRSALRVTMASSAQRCGT